MRDKMKIAVIFESSPFDRKGLFNAVHNRIKHLAVAGAGKCTVDAYCIHSVDNAFTRRVRHTPEITRTDTVRIDGIEYRMLWYRFSVIDDLLYNKLHLRPLFFGSFVKKAAAQLRGYDVVAAHSFAGAVVAYAACRLGGVPFYVSWHGSDVHTHPKRNPRILREIRTIMEAASCNFFVSASLLEASGYITQKACKKVLYNGVSEAFFRLSAAEKETVRKNYGVSPAKKIVAFAGSLVAVKNVGVLQPLFHAMRAGFDGEMEFWIVGDGKLGGSVRAALSSDNTLRVRFWGNVPAGEMPALMNCIDLLVLPSLNEGLPLVAIEALKCGAPVIGSAAGGIPEVIGKEYTVPLGPAFVEEMAALGCRILLGGGQTGSVPEEMDWNRTAAAELDFVLGMQ